MRPFLLVPALVALLTVVGAAQTPPSQAYQDFASRVQDYVKLRNGVQSSLPKQKPTKKRKQINERQMALAQKIREARSSARQGDIFTPAVAAQIRPMIQGAFQGPNAKYIRKTIREGEELKGSFGVNANYPEHLPLTTVPPTLLLNLPELPKELTYHIVGHDLILLDNDARMVIDLIPGAIP